MNAASGSWQGKLVLALSVLVALAFFAAGSTKLASLPFQVENFTRWGYPQWFRYVTGVVEVGSAVLLLVPRTRRLGAGLLAITMLCAIATHVRANEAHMAVPATVFLLLCVLFLYRFRNSESRG